MMSTVTGLSTSSNSASPPGKKWKQQTHREVIDAIRIAGLANQKGPRIQRVLAQIHAERGELSLDFLKDMPRDDARQWLLKFKGVGPKTAAIVPAILTG